MPRRSQPAPAATPTVPCPVGTAFVNYEYAYIRKWTLGPSNIRKTFVTSGRTVGSNVPRCLALIQEYQVLKLELGS